ncbi:AI-2E family transporter [Roseiconus lacunae]|uniref:AI-2E family transporter n=1 Tax=Roseiconus lacunae TaxID=2605694 RepID=A0ABT7PQ80_9BACT|nr:AI-2E family transporter [Roseiconus lacunae]MDM4018659.1 AI-2E family transporter [Roseiconus lacunae]
MNDRVAPSSSFYLVILFTAIIATSLLLAYEVFLVLFLGLIFGVFLTHLRKALARATPLSETWSLGIVVAALLVLMGIGVLIFFVQAQSQMDRMADTLEKGASRLLETVDDYPTVKSMVKSTPILNEFVKGQRANSGNTESNPKANRDSASEQTNTSSMSNGWSSPIENAARAAGQVFQTTLGFVVNALLIFFVGIFIASSPSIYHRGFVRLFPVHKRERVSEIVSATVETLWRWTLGRLATMAITGFGAFLLLTVLGIPMATTIGLLTAILTFVPNIGAVVAFGLSLLVALPEGTTPAILVSVGYVGLQLLESYVITPLIQQKQVAMPPALLISFQAFLGVALGFLGAVVASPLLAAGSTIVKMAYIEDVLEDESDAE